MHLKLDSVSVRRSTKVCCASPCLGWRLSRTSLICHMTRADGRAQRCRLPCCKSGRPPGLTCITDNGSAITPGSPAKLNVRGKCTGVQTWSPTPYTLRRAQDVMSYQCPSLAPSDEGGAVILLCRLLSFRTFRDCLYRKDLG